MNFSKNTPKAKLEDMATYPPATVTTLEQAVSEYAGLPTVAASQCPECGRLLTLVGININLCPHACQAQYVEFVETTIFKGKRDPIYTIGQWFWVIITFGIAYLFYWYKSLSTAYWITNQRIILIKGILFKRKQFLELIYVDDFELENSPGMRWLGYGILHLTSSDPRFSEVNLYGIKGIEDICEQLRKATMREQIRRNVEWRKEA